MAKKHKTAPFIVKVQVSIVTGAQKKQVLVYNEDRSLTFQDDASRGLIRRMGGSPKQYFWATLRDAEIHLGEAAPWQEW
jgi:hypothetical protein